MKKRLLLWVMTMTWLNMVAQTVNIPFGKGTLRLTPLTENALRVEYAEGNQKDSLPEWVYVKTEATKWKDRQTRKMQVKVDAERQTLTIMNAEGQSVFVAKGHELTKDATGKARLTIESPKDEHLYGMGQFQDGHNNIRGLSRRLTQVNTQTSIPMLISSKGYGLLWNNYGMTLLNPCLNSIVLQKAAEEGVAETVNVTSTEGNRQEVRRQNRFAATIDIAEEGDYALLLDVGQKMARRHNLSIDGRTIIEMRNLWLPPTASEIVHLEKGKHQLTAELSGGDQPVVYYNKVKNETVLESPVAQMVDYTVFVGSADEVIAAYREVTGAAPLMPRWALGYIHCRERFHSQNEILETAQRFRREQLPVDMLVQDWQYWGPHGWNSMKFDESNYPDPKALTDSLHGMNLKLMLSVWSKIDRNSEVGREMAASGYYIPNTDWIDFFNPAAAKAYWKNFSQRLLPTGIDAWWQDATEPENDDLEGRLVNNGQWKGETFRCVYPLLVNKTVCEGLLNDQPSRRPMILTRSGFAGIQRYGSALWSGDVGNDWETFRRQITAGLGLQAAGIPWWTYDAGGFFRPQNQYSDKAYIERMLRWIETSVYLPLMRVHGYMSDTEPWRYGKEAQQVIAQCLKERYRLLPYIYSYAAAISTEGSTLMRPLVFDFADDAEALQQEHEYMFGRSLLVNPVTEPNVTEWTTYLPRHAGGWYDRLTGRHYEGGQQVTTAVDRSRIPVFVCAGSIVPTGPDVQSTADDFHSIITLNVYPGQDASFTFYDDDGESNGYLQEQCSRMQINWDNTRQTLTLNKRKGSYKGMPRQQTFVVRLPDGTMRQVVYKGKRTVVSMR